MVDIAVYCYAVCHNEGKLLVVSILLTILLKCERNLRNSSRDYDRTFLFSLRILE